MEAKEILTRLEIVKLATSIGDHDTVIIQNSFLKNANNGRLNEIISLLTSKNYRQALYLIKGFISDLDSDIVLEKYEQSDEERVLGVEDMLKMSPLAKESIKDFKKNSYTSDDLEAFAKKIEKPISDEYSSISKAEPKVDKGFVDKLEKQEKLKKEQEYKAQLEKERAQKEIEERSLANDIQKAVKKADSDTPLDEISSEGIGNSSAKKSRKSVLSKYKTLREKFSRKDNKQNDTSFKSSQVAQNIVKKAKVDAEEQKEKEDISSSEGDAKRVLNNKKDSSLNNITQEAIKDKKVDSAKDKEVTAKNKESNDIKNSNNKDIEEDSKSKKQKEKTAETKEEPKKVKKVKKSAEDSIIYAPIPHIEQKFRQSFILYPPKKESEIWTEEVIIFLKRVAKESFTEADVKSFINEFDYFMGKKDLARAAQVLLLASSTDSKFAQFLLARELFSGNILVRDLKKSFVIMKELANQFYPEAVCDLGQFYEYGIGVAKDRKVAIKLYEKAFELGVARATKHINRLKESNSFLSTVFKLK